MCPNSTVPQKIPSLRKTSLIALILQWMDPYNYFPMALHSKAKNWIKFVCETDKEFQPTWDFIKPQFKIRFGKKMDVAKVRTVLDNLKILMIQWWNLLQKWIQISASLGNSFQGGKLSTFQLLQQTETMRSVRVFTITQSITLICIISNIFSLPTMQPVAAKDPATFTVGPCVTNFFSLTVYDTIIGL